MVAPALENVLPLMPLLSKNPGYATGSRAPSITPRLNPLLFLTLLMMDLLNTALWADLLTLGATERLPTCELLILSTAV